jgi:hypothetical protein
MDSQQYELEVEVDKGSRAKTLLEGISPYFDQLEDNLIEQFKALSVTSPQSDEVLKMIKLQHLALSNVRRSIVNAVETGKMAFHSLYGEVE